MGEELIPDGLRKLTEKVYDVLVPGVGAILWLILCFCAWYGVTYTPCPKRTTGRP